MGAVPSIGCNLTRRVGIFVATAIAIRPNTSRRCLHYVRCRSNCCPRYPLDIHSWTPVLIWITTGNSAESTTRRRRNQEYIFRDRKRSKCHQCNPDPRFPDWHCRHQPPVFCFRARVVLRLQASSHHIRAVRYSLRTTLTSYGGADTTCRY